MIVNNIRRNLGLRRCWCFPPTIKLSPLVKTTTGAERHNESTSFRIPAFEYIIFILVFIGGVRNLKLNIKYFIVVFLFCIPLRRDKLRRCWCFPPTIKLSPLVKTTTGAERHNASASFLK
jgi:hypothetical protein